MPVRAVIAHRSALVRDVLRLLGVASEIYVVGEATSAASLAELCEEERPGVVLTEADFGRGAMIEQLIPDIIAAGSRVIVICDDPSPERLTDILALGASGYLRSDVGPAEVVAAVEAVATGEAVLNPAATETILDQWRRLRGAAEGPHPGMPDLTAPVPS